jgi:two-component system invasion response regulator UvrY
MIRVLIVDDHELVRTGIKRILEDTRDIRVVAEASTGEEALGLVREHRPDVVLMDVNMPGIGGLEATRKLIQSHPELRVIVVTIHVDEPYPTRLLEAGASGYLTKGCAVDEIVDAIQVVHRGERYIGADIARQLALSMLPGGERSPFDKLSQREMQVMLMVTQGHSIQDISDRLSLSPKTISTYRYRLYEKLGVDNDVELTHLAMRHGMIEVGQQSGS